MVVDGFNMIKALNVKTLWIILHKQLYRGPGVSQKISKGGGGVVAVSAFIVLFLFGTIFFSD